ncbi:MAG TPA: FHA domain-containing protein [Chloroflexota bacterium]|nr:FHA domain-containing protein [Chloroflexota bacterium]
MLFHVTLTHSQTDCPGRRPAETPELIGPADRLEALGVELSVRSHSVVWGAACLLWAEPEHVVYALLEAPSLDAVERYIGSLTPAGWSTRILPVFALPSQLAAARQFLAAPVSPFVPALAPEMPLEEPAALLAEPVTSAESADTLDGELPVVEAPEPPEPPLERRVTREVPHVLEELPVAVPPPPPPPGLVPNRVTLEEPQPVSTASTVVRPAAAEPVATPEPSPKPDTEAVTRFIARPGVLEGPGSASPTPPPVAPSQSDEPPGLDRPSEPYLPSESSTVILEPTARRAPGLRLVAIAGPAQGTVFEIGEAGATLGRLPENSICLTDGRLSRYHARIEFRDGSYWLSDLGSQNGTLVNDRPVTDPHRLQPGESLQLGTSRLTVRLDPDD